MTLAVRSADGSQPAVTGAALGGSRCGTAARPPAVGLLEVRAGPSRPRAGRRPPGTRVSVIRDSRFVLPPSAQPSNTQNRLRGASELTPFVVPPSGS